MIHSTTATLEFNSLMGYWDCTSWTQKLLKNHVFDRFRPNYCRQIYSRDQLHATPCPCPSTLESRDSLAPRLECCCCTVYVYDLRNNNEFPVTVHTDNIDWVIQNGYGYGGSTDTFFHDRRDGDINQNGIILLVRRRAPRRLSKSARYAERVSASLISARTVAEVSLKLMLGDSTSACKSTW